MSEQLDQAFEALKTYDWGADPNTVKAIDDEIVATHGNAAARKTLEGRLVLVLKSDAPRAAKDVACRALKTIGTANAVPVLATLLADEKLSHMARYALERIPAPEAGQALRTALAKVAGKLKVGVISSLGARREEASVAPLQVLLADPDAAVAQAAAHALGDIGSLAATKALVTAKAADAAKGAIADASMQCAEHLLAAHNKAAAKATYEKVLAGSPSAAVKTAATLGLQATAAK